MERGSAVSYWSVASYLLVPGFCCLRLSLPKDNLLFKTISVRYSDID